MSQLLLEGPAKLRWNEVDEPELDDPAAAIVRPVAVTTCDIDVAVLRGAYPLAGPYPFGHEAVARVIEVDDFAPEALSPIYKKPADVHQFFQELGEQRAAS